MMSKYDQIGHGQQQDGNGFYRIGGTGQRQIIYEQQQNQQEFLHEQQQMFYSTPNGPSSVDQYMGGQMVVGWTPDSDLETIAEESSVLDSEAGSVVRHHNSADSSGDSTLSGYSSVGSMTRRKDETRSSLTSSSDTSSRGDVMKFHHPHHHQQQMMYNNNRTSSAMTNLPAQQEIVFAKCIDDDHYDNRQLLRHKGGRSHSNTKQQVIPPTPPQPDDDMFEAARTGNLHALGRFTDEDLSSTLDENGNTLMHVAAENGQLDCIRRLVSIYTPNMVILPNDDIMTATGLAIKNGHTTCAKWMIENTSAKEELCMSRQVSNIDGYNTRDPVAHIAARYGREELLDWICEQMAGDDISVDIVNHKNDAAIHVAARYGHINCVQALASRGASCTNMNAAGETPAEAAQKSGYSVCVGYLVVVETCVTLAQQLVGMKYDYLTLKSSYDELKQQYDKLESKQQQQGQNNNNKNGLPNGVMKTENLPPMLINKNDAKTISAPPAVQTITNHHQPPQIRRTLQQQPPPPKIWLSTAATGGDKDETGSAKSGGSTGSAKSRKSKKSPRNSAENDAKMNKESDEVESLTKGLKMDKKPWETLSIDEILKMVREVRYQPSPSISHFTEDSQMESKEVMKDRLAAASRWFLVDHGKGKLSNGTGAVSAMNRRRCGPQMDTIPTTMPINQPLSQKVTNLDLQNQLRLETANQNAANKQHQMAANNKPKPMPKHDNSPPKHDNSPLKHDNSPLPPSTVTSQRKSTSKSPTQNGVSHKKPLTETPSNNALLVTKSSGGGGNHGNGISEKRAVFESRHNRKSRSNGENQNPPAVQNHQDSNKIDSNVINKDSVTPNKPNVFNGNTRMAPNSARQLNSSTQRSGSYRRAVWSQPYLRNTNTSNENNKTISSMSERLHQNTAGGASNTRRNGNEARDDRLSPPSEGEKKKSVGMWTKPHQAPTSGANSKSAASATVEPPRTKNNSNGVTKSYNWVNSYFRNRSSTSSSHHDDVTNDVGESPAEIRHEIATPRQSSFLRKVQGKRHKAKV